MEEHKGEEARKKKTKWWVQCEAGFTQNGTSYSEIKEIQSS